MADFWRGMRMKKSVVLIGMPAAGKSTVGVILAKTLGKQFVDTDLLIQEREGMLLQEIINTKGDAYFRQVENGKFVRMALIYTLLQWAEAQPETSQTPRLGDGQVHNDWRCSNRQCISNWEDVNKLFHETADGYRCAYCEARVKN